MSSSKDSFQRHSVFKQDSNHDFDHMNGVYTGYEHDDLVQTVSQSIKTDGETLFHKASDQVNRIFQGVSDLIDAPSRLANSIQEIW